MRGMAPSVDVYVRLPQCNRSQVERFLDEHVETWRHADVWLSEDASTLLEGGLSGSSTGDVLYAPEPHIRDADLEYIIVAFPRAGGVVLGASVDLSPDEPAAMTEAEQVLRRFLQETGASEGFVQVEEPPPLTEEGWQEAMQRAHKAVYP
jgi:hypothetical protein